MTPESITIELKNPSMQKDHCFSRQAWYSVLEMEFKASEISKHTHIFLNYCLISFKDTQIRKKNIYMFS